MSDQTLTLTHSTDAARTAQVPVVKLGGAHIVVRLGDADVRFSRKTGTRIGATHTRGVGYDDWTIAAEHLAALTGEAPTAPRGLALVAPPSNGEEAPVVEAPAPKRARKAKVAAVAPVVEAPVAEAPAVVEPEAPAPTVASVNAQVTAPVEPPTLDGCHACHVAQMIAADDAIGGEFLSAADRERQEAQVAAAGPHTCVDPDGDHDAPSAPAVVEAPAVEPLPEPQASLARAVQHIAQVQDLHARLALAALTDALRIVIAAQEQGAKPAAVKAPRAPKSAAPKAPRAPVSIPGTDAEGRRRIYNATLWPFANKILADGGSATTAEDVSALLARKYGDSVTPELATWAFETTSAFLAKKSGTAVPKPATSKAPRAPKPATASAPKTPKAPKVAPLAVGSKVDIKEALRDGYVDVIGLSQMVGLTIEALTGKHARVRTNTGVVFPKIALADLAPAALAPAAS